MGEEQAKPDQALGGRAFLRKGVCCGRGCSRSEAQGTCKFMGYLLGGQDRDTDHFSGLLLGARTLAGKRDSQVFVFVSESL